MNVVRGSFGPLPLEEAKKIYVQHWRVLNVFADDTTKFLASWDIIKSLEIAHTFSKHDLDAMRKEADIHVGVKRVKGPI